MDKVDDGETEVLTKGVSGSTVQECVIMVVSVWLRKCECGLTEARAHRERAGLPI